MHRSCAVRAAASAAGKARRRGLAARKAAAEGVARTSGREVLALEVEPGATVARRPDLLGKIGLSSNIFAAAHIQPIADDL